MIQHTYNIQSASIFGEQDEEFAFELERIDTMNGFEYYADVVCHIERQTVERFLIENTFRLQLEVQKVIAPMQFPLIPKFGSYIEPRTFEEWIEQSSKGARNEALYEFIEAHKELINESTQSQFSRFMKKTQYPPLKKVAWKTQ